jgi:hypothetical protein
MRRLAIPGGWYAEALTTGEYVSVVRGSHIETHLGRIALPAPNTEPLYVRASAIGGFRFAGQASVATGTLEWVQGQGWRHDLATNWGVSGAIYDATGTLRISHDPAVGSQGWRYVEDGSGRLVSGDATYADLARRICEWTTHGDLTIGQDADHDRCLVLRGSERRVLDEGGECRFVRFNRTGTKIAVAIAKFRAQQSVLIWMDIADLAALPTITIGTPAPPPHPPPTEPDVTEEQVKKIVDAALKPLVARLAALEHAVAPVPQPNPPVPQPNPNPEPTPPPEPSPAGDFPEALVVLADAKDIREWPATSEVTEAFVDNNKGVVIKHTKAGEWPVLTGEGGGGEGNPWVIAIVRGQWYTATYEWLRPGQTAKLGGKIETIGAHTKKDPLDTWVPVTGERIGLFVSTFARDRRRSFPERAIKGERSNVAWVKWP